MPGEKIRTKQIRVQVKRMITFDQYYLAIGFSLICISVVVIIVFIIFAFRKFEVQHELACRSGIPQDYEKNTTYKVKTERESDRHSASTDVPDSAQSGSQVIIRPKKGVNLGCFLNSFCFYFD